MSFDALEAVKASAGETHELAVVLQKARALPARFEQRSRHFEFRTDRGATV